MGKRTFQHSDMCGCERCAKAWESDNPQPVWETVEDPDYLDCGCHASHCDCDFWDWDDNDDRDD